MVGTCLTLGRSHLVATKTHGTRFVTVVSTPSCMSKCGGRLI